MTCEVAQKSSDATTRRSFCLGLASGAVAFGLGCVGSRCSAYENAAVRAAIRKYIEGGLYAGLACASSRGDLYLEGSRRIDDPKLPVTADTLFDLASVGKTQTAALCALLYADGKLDVDAPFTEYIKDHVLAKENCRITVRDLATHSGGFDNSKPYMVADPAAMFRELYCKRPVWPRGERYCYACSNFVYLGLIVEKLTGLDLDAAARKMLWGPLGMSRTTWNTVVGDQDVAEYPQSTYGGQKRKIGEHNDICAHLAPRPMGNGANFSTAPDMLRFVTDMLRRERFPVLRTPVCAVFRQGGLSPKLRMGDDSGEICIFRLDEDRVFVPCDLPFWMDGFRRRSGSEVRLCWRRTRQQDSQQGEDHGPQDEDS